MLKGLTESLSRWLDVAMPELPASDRDDFARALTYTNLRRERAMAWIVAVTMPAIMLTEANALAELEVSSAHWAEWQGIAFLRLLSTAAAALFLALVRRPQSAAEINRRHHLSAMGFVVFMLLTMALLTGIGQPLRSSILISLAQSPVSSIGAYVIATFAFATFLNMGRSLLVAYGIAWAVVVTLLYRAQPHWAFAILDIINVTLMTLLCVVLSRVIYTTRVKEFLHLRLIERQQQELAESNEKLRLMSLVDPATGVPNRRFFDDYLGKEWARAVREGTTLSLIMIDIDYFKWYNDEYGHQAGDKCLVQVAGCFQESLKRPADFVARYGGDEFVAVLPDTDVDGTTEVAARMAQTLYDLDIPHVRAPNRRLTVSIGIAARRPQPSEHPDGLVAAADEALYQAKAAGRDRLAWAS